MNTDVIQLFESGILESLQQRSVCHLSAFIGKRQCQQEGAGVIQAWDE